MSEENTTFLCRGGNENPSSRSAPPDRVDSSRWFTEEIQPHEPQLRAFLRRSVACLADLDDLVQECFIRTLRAQNSGPIRSGRAFLFTVARNAVYDLVPAARAVATVSITETAALPVLDDDKDVADLVSHRQELALLAAAIRELPERCRQVFLLRKIQELPQKEIAVRLGISENTVETLVAKGALRCANYLQKRGIGPRSNHAR